MPFSIVFFFFFPARDLMTVTHECADDVLILMANLNFGVFSFLAKPF